MGFIQLASDALRFDSHMIRYLYLALFDDRVKSYHLSRSLYLDTFLTLGIITPLFIVGLKFWTAPVYTPYASKINALVAPFGIIVAFISNHADVIMMGTLVALMNAYVFWYHVDPPAFYT